MARKRSTGPLEVATDLTEPILEGVESLLEAFTPSSRRRRQWSSLSASQKKRYLSAGRTGRLNGRPGLSARQVRDYYNRGGSLKSARGYHPPKGAAPTKATMKASTGRATAQDVASLKEWRQSDKRPRWIPVDRAIMSDDTAAALSRIGAGPKSWKTVSITMLPDRSGFLMTVTTKRGAVYVTSLPDRASLSEVTSLLRGHAGDFAAPGEREYLDKAWGSASFSVFVSYADELVIPTDSPAPPPNRGRALPTKKRTKR